MIFATYLAPVIRPVYEYVARRVGDKLGLETELIDGRSFDDFAAGRVDAGFICGLPYVRLAAESPAPVELVAAPVLLGERYGGSPVYFSDVVVRRDSGIESFDGLGGKRWAFNDPDSNSGHLITLWKLLDRDLSPAFFGEVVQAGSHQRSIDLVLAGEVDGAAIDSQVLAVVAAREPRVNDELRVIETWGPSPIQPLVVSTRIKPALRKALTEVVLGLPDRHEASQTFAQCQVERFAAVEDVAYDAIRSRLHAVEAVGQTKLLP